MNASLNSEILINTIFKIKINSRKDGFTENFLAFMMEEMKFLFLIAGHPKSLPCFPKSLPCFPKSLPCFSKRLPCFPKSLPGFPKSLPSTEKSTQVAFSGNQPVSLSFTFANKDNSYDLSFFPFFKNNNENGMESNHEYVFFEARIIFNISCIHNI